MTAPSSTRPGAPAPGEDRAIDVVGSALDRVVAGERLDEHEAADVMAAIMQGTAQRAQVAALAVAWAMRGETVDELAGLARAARDRAVTVPHPGPLLDTCGTGGDGLDTFNISTAAALVAAGAGAVVAKHGNRSASSGCGSADVLEHLGVRIEVGPDEAAASLRARGITFLHAATYHPAFGHVAAARRELGIPTVFNLVGPLCNPARATHHTLGVAREELVAPMAEVLERLGVTRAMVFHAEDGMDELSTTAPSHVVEILDGRRRAYRLDPAAFGLAAAAPGDLSVGRDPAAGAAVLRAVLAGRTGPARDVVLFNAAASLYTAARATDLTEGLELARRAVDGGAARALLDDWVAESTAAGQAPAGVVS